MTWTKTGGEFASDAANINLSDAAYRTHHEVIEWIYRVERMDCRVPARLVRRIAGSDQHEAAIQELLDVGFWRRDGEDYEVVHHGDVIRQSIAAQVKKRDTEKIRQRRYRQRKAREDSAEVSADVTTNVTRDVTPAVTPNADSQSATDFSHDQGEEGDGRKAFDDEAWLNGGRVTL